MTHSLRAALTAAFALSATLGLATAQARYDVFGNTCAGTGRVAGPVIAGINPDAGPFQNMASIGGRKYAICLKAAVELEVGGIQMFAHSRCSNPHIVTMELRADDNGLPGATLASGTTLVGAQPVPEWYKVTLWNPIKIGEGLNYWIVFDNPDCPISMPVLSSGNTCGHAYQEPNSSVWVTSTEPLAWSLRLNGVSSAAPACTGAMGSANIGLPVPDATLQENTDFAIPFDATGRGGKVCGLWMVTNNRGAPQPVQVTSHLWLDAGGTPGQLVRSGTFTIDKDTVLYRSYWDGYPVVRGQRLWIGWSNPAPSINANLAEGGVVRSYAMRPMVNGGWSVIDTKLPWNFLIKMTDETGDEHPILTASGSPRLGQSFDVLLSFAPPEAVALLWNGSSNRTWASIELPFAVPASYGCFVHVAWDAFMLGTVATKVGNAVMKFSVPNDQSLAGLALHQQWLVLDALANPLGVTSSNGGTAVLGN